MALSRAFVKEDEERGNVVSDLEYRRKKLDWLKIQEKKLDKLLNDSASGKIKPETRERWIKETREDIQKTKRELNEL